MAPPALRRLSLLVLAFALAMFGVAASGGGQTLTADPGPDPDPGPMVIVPGRPGEPAQLRPADKVKAPDGTKYSAADVWFVRMMIPHHAQAIEMASLARGRANNPQITAIAERIMAAQPPEILQLKAWLKQHGLPEEDTGAGHDHGSMPGMQPPEAVRALANAKGDQFDRMFVILMTGHHRGAIEMAGLRLRSNGDLMVERMANAIGFEQEVEINRMREILGS